MAFADLVDHAMLDPALAGMRPVVEKEILHYGILAALERKGFFKDLVFQGGTSLRLCHGAPRFSEDLDFVGGPRFAAAQLREIRACVEEHIGRKYGLEVHVKEPREMREEPSYLGTQIDRWQIAVVTNQGRSDLPRQKIKLEVANVPAWTREPRTPVRNYQGLPAGFMDIIIPTETLAEVMADKVVSLTAATEHVRNRDIWDLRWLRLKGARLDLDLVRRKLTDYRIEDFEDKLEGRLASLETIVNGKTFQDELGRFLPSDVRERTLEKSGFLTVLARDVGQLLDEARQGLFREAPAEAFPM
ncbi:nucleotidyl transferase AbiEii/AbiGii toxin family protein [Cereibacter sphaeroides]|uniref:nucleotidyl transferase AbiEii/AbiGii toxin family protein n=1 Tax=Cereibacter sphaeroides TaxID=1063 RepID=UPI001F256028|nr:nucleotidyl transferase AbiEii/AbiGii toxin family protein [Cereibacter sphaeroides]MCE6959567.1 nucleotidyl transferase AbiEii/AbiGii toxin family protein [Cereibacter sphaeroides]MCE6974573.1 nucleotidyl transferase AbiEii/AbiGii toxin family protein [Cereibacter sphaeroides]